MAKRKLKRQVSRSEILSEADKRRLFCWLARFADSPAGRQKALIFDIMINTGLRSSEVCRLKVRNTPIIVGRNVLEIKRSKGRNRSVPISEALAWRIDAYIEGDRYLRIPRHIRGDDGNGWLFYNVHCRQMRYQALYSMVVRAGVKAGIRKHIRPHFLRHTFATDAIAGGVPINDLQHIMGHSQLATTARYLHVIGDRQFAYAETLEAGFSRVVPNYCRENYTQSKGLA